MISITLCTKNEQGMGNIRDGIVVNGWIGKTILRQNILQLPGNSYQKDGAIYNL